ncbi:hypothetical protein M405DRAFT_864806 [Rhizopogon salebrosus TDB-379]|nr:hypothetical protein M405DRAFT_864806 [Rhizopogon salebrosus TDB-379]
MTPIKRSLSSLFLRLSTPHARPHDYHPLRILSNKPPHNVRNLQSTSAHPTRHLSSPHLLAGGSEVGEALARPGILEHFLGNKSAIWGADAIDLTAYATDIRGTWMRMWALDSEDADIIAVLDYVQSDLPNSGQEGEPPGTRLARIKAQLLMLKLQREGGGLNIDHEPSPALLDGLCAEEREAWIAMETIETLRKVGI